MNRKRTLAISALHFSADLYSLFFPIYMVIAGLEPARAAMIFAVSSLAANGLQPAMGLWADRVRGKLPVFLGLVVGALAMSLIGLTRSYALLTALVVVGRLGISLFHPAASNIAGAATETWHLTGVGPVETVDEVSHPTTTIALTSESTAATNRRVFARTRSAVGSTVATAEWLLSKHHSSSVGIRLSHNMG